MCSHVIHNDKSINKDIKNAAISGISPAVVAIGAPLGHENTCFKTRFVYNSKVKPALVEANLARRATKNSQTYVKGRIFGAGGSNGGDAVVGHNVIDNSSQMSSEVQTSVCDNVSGQELNRANCANTTGGIDRRTMCQPVLTDSI